VRRANAGNLALTFCAQGGVYIAGDIVPRFADRLVESSFRTQFESKGRYESYLRNIPTSIIVRPDASFIGLKAFYERNMVVTWCIRGWKTPMTDIVTITPRGVAKVLAMTDLCLLPTLANSTSAPSPTSFMGRPPCCAKAGSSRSVRCSVSIARVLLSSRSIRRE
jgi:hypothetical protein